MTTPARPDGPPNSLFLEIRLVALLIAYNGRLPAVEARRFARTHLDLGGSLGYRPNGQNRGSRASAAIYKAVKLLRSEGLADRDGDDIVADDLTDLADWLADRLTDLDEAPTRAGGGDQ